MKKDVKEKSRRLIKRFVNPQGLSSLGWPPGCTGLFYQPERQIINDDKKDITDKTD